MRDAIKAAQAMAAAAKDKLLGPFRRSTARLEAIRQKAVRSALRSTLRKRSRWAYRSILLTPEATGVALTAATAWHSFFAPSRLTLIAKVLAFMLACSVLYIRWLTVGHRPRRRKPRPHSPP